MFLNIPTGGDCFKRLVVRYCARLCAHVLIVCLLGQTLIVLPLPRVRANIAQLPAPISEPPMPFELADGASAISLLTKTAGIIASLFAFVVPKEKETIPGIESAVLEPLRNKAANAAAPAPPPAGEIKYDFDNDGKADIGRWRRVATEFKVKNSNGDVYSTYTLGSSGAVAAPGDFNGDRRTDAAVFNAGTWTYKTSPTANAQTIAFGTAGDVPYAGDYDGDRITDAAVFRPTTNTWRVRQSTNGTTVTYPWGAAGDIPITGNWDGDSKTDIAVYRNGTWYIRKSSGGNLYLNWGLSSDIPVQGDFDGDGKSDVTVFRPTTGTWYILKSSSNWASYSTANWGVWSDQPTPADYDGDSITDLSIWRPTDGNWYTIKSSDNTYQIQTLGNAGDTAVPSAYTKQVGGTASGDVINAERIKPRNATGGTNLYSQNFGWGTSLVGLPGRAGLDADFGIGYNSLTWLKVGNAMYFDPDKSNVTPGFRMGFPVIEPIYYNATRQKWAYMMVTTSGSRVEFIETAASSVYETSDSSYTQLVVTGATNPFDPVENLSIRVTTTDGTQMTYAWGVGSYKCTQIKDRNGNYITLAYDSLARLSVMTDTLGRVVTVNYGSNGLPSTITQTWKDNNGAGSSVTHTWATFAYTTKSVDTDFATNLSIVGPPDGTVFTVLDKITYPDLSSTKFEYNDYLQVKKVSSVAADSPTHVLNYVSTNLSTPTSAQSDCPRFTETRSWVENFNQNSSGTAQEVVIPNSFTTDQQYTLPTGGTATGNLLQITSPDGTVEKTFTGNTGWREGLPIATETWANINNTLTKKRWTWTDYTQDDVNLAYVKNPRVIESKVGDTENSFVRRSTVEYLMQSGSNTLTQYGLIRAVNVYDADQTTVLKRSETDYNLAAAYTSRRIIGLPIESRAYGRENGLLPLVSKMTHAYDEENFSYETNQKISSVIQHDTAYGSSFIVGRANLTSATRHDVTGQTPSSTSRLRYDIAGSVVAKLDPLNRKVAINYTDSFNDNVVRNSFAYPTTLTDPANNASTVKYRFDIGANVRAQSPAPAGNTTGKITERLFDSIGRLQKDMIVNTGAYTRYEYPTNGVQSKVFSTIVDANNNNTGDAADEVMSESWADGAGRVRRSRTEHPGSVGGWSGSIVEFDILGQVKRSSVQTEISVPDANNPDTWAPAGDDYTRGWLWTYQKYDWKGRVVRKINTDGVDSPTLNDSDILISYDGCGCAGGQVTTIENERVPIPGTGNYGRRKQKVYEDILGRAFKTEVLNWDGSVYSTTVETYNGRDQITNTRQSDGPSGGSVFRDVTMSYDGHGRMKTRHYPIENAGANTTWNYNADDTINAVTDPRGVVTSFAYNSRGLITGISYDPGGSGVADTPDVGFQFDNLGNRIVMADGTGSTSYVYDSMSQITSETKYITELNQSFTINYTYTLNGAVQSFTDPQDSARKAEYSFDKTGRISEMRGLYSGTINQKLTGTQYRAWGALKKHDFVTIGSASTISIPVQFEYDNRLQVSAHYSTYAPNPSGYVHNVEYARNADGKISLSEDTQMQSFTRNFEYDHVGRVTKSLSGHAAHGISGTEVPYRTAIFYNSFSETISIIGKHWEASNPPYNLQLDSTTGRMTGVLYDASGNILRESTGIPTARTYAYDAAGRNTTSLDPGIRATESDKNFTNIYDGNGWRVKTQTDDSGGWTKIFEISSTVLGGATVGSWEFDNGPNTPDRKKFTASANGVKMSSSSPATYGNFEWLSPEGTTMYGGIMAGVAEAEFDPRGGNVGTENPYSGGGGYGGGGYPAQNDGQYYGRCAEGGVPVSCDKQARINQAFDIIADRIQADSANSPGLDPSTGSHERLNKTEHEKDTTLEGRQTTETEKPETDPTKGKTVDPESVPDASGENSDGCIYGADGGPNSCTVQSLPVEETLVDASRSRGMKRSDCGKPGQPPCPKKHKEAAAKSPCADGILREYTKLRDDSATVPIKPYIHKSIEADFQAALNEINRVVPGGIGFTEMYRTYADQKGLYDAYEARLKKGIPGNPAAPPGTSRHESGFAFDVKGMGTWGNSSALAKTIIPIFAKYGFDWGDQFEDQPHFQADFRRGGYRTSTEAATAARNYYNKCIK